MYFKRYTLKGCPQTIYPQGLYRKKIIIITIGYYVYKQFDQCHTNTNRGSLHSYINLFIFLFSTITIVRTFFYAIILM